MRGGYPARRAPRRLFGIALTENAAAMRPGVHTAAASSTS